ncbi:MAG: cyanophycinase [Acidobacteriota bacterium]|nr:cyanophycinase [Blastocatellia bacterium]MDW8412615.1 cyanophycinase [Acidobacteriota bacterium]
MQGALVAIGGAEDRYEEKFILNKFFQLAGGKQARVVILPSASSDERTGSTYQRIFREFGAASVEVLPLFRREDAEDPAVAEQLKAASGIFMTGGDQNRIMAVLESTQALDAIVEANGRGTVVGGTSAGAAALSNPMIAGGMRGSLARSGMTRISTGIGLARGFIIDQHFSQRERLGRLLYAVILHPECLGLGVDEDTAAIIKLAEGEVEVIGRGTVTIVDGSSVKMFNPASVPDKSPIVYSGMLLHSFTHGCRFSIKDRTLVMNRRVHGE